MNTQPNVPASYETPAETAFNHRCAMIIVRVNLPFIAKRTEALLNAMPDKTPWGVRVRALDILKQLETLQNDLADALGGAS
jgi:hypothetical protein